MACNVTPEAVKLIAEFVNAKYQENNNISIEGIATDLYNELSKTKATQELIKAYLESIPDIIDKTFSVNDKKNIKTNYNEVSYIEHINSLLNQSNVQSESQTQIVTNEEPEQATIPSEIYSTPEGQKLQDDVAEEQEQIVDEIERQNKNLDHNQIVFKEHEGNVDKSQKEFLESLKEALENKYSKNTISNILKRYGISLNSLFTDTGRNIFIVFDAIVKIHNVPYNYGITKKLLAIQEILDELINNINSNGYQESTAIDLLNYLEKDLVKVAYLSLNPNTKIQNLKSGIDGFILGNTSASKSLVEGFKNITIENGEFISSNITNGYEVFGNNAFFNKEYYNSGFHRILFKCLHELSKLFYNVDNKGKIKYKAISARKLLESNLRIIGEGSSFTTYRLEDEKESIRSNVKNVARRGVIKLVYDNLTPEERKQIINEWQKVTENKVPDSVSINTEEKKYGSYLSFVFMYANGTTEFINAVEKVAGTKLAFIIPIDENGNEILFNGAGLTNERLDKNKAIINDEEVDTPNINNNGTYDVNENFGNNKNISYDKNNVPENKCGIIAIPLHSVTDNRREHVSKEVSDNMQEIISGTQTDNVSVDLAFYDSAFFIQPESNVYLIDKGSLEIIDEIPVVEKCDGSKGNVNNFVPFQLFLDTHVRFKDGNVLLTNEEQQTIYNKLKEQGIEIDSQSLETTFKLHQFLSKQEKNVYFSVIRAIHDMYYSTIINDVTVNKVEFGKQLDIFDKISLYKYTKDQLKRLQILFQNNSDSNQSVFETRYFVPSEWVQTKYPMSVKSYTAKIAGKNVTANNSFSFYSRPKVLVYKIYNDYVDGEQSKQTTENISNTGFINQTEEESIIPSDVAGTYFQSSIYGKSLEATEQLLKDALTWWESSPLSKIIKLEMSLQYLGDRNNFAEIHDAIITLYKNANNTSLYHEAFHVLTQYCMTQNERNELYNELRRSTGKFKDYNGRTIKFKNATNLQCEEYLAESFRHYMMTGNMPLQNSLTIKEKTLFERIEDLFKKIFDWIKWHLNMFSDVSNYNDALPKIEKLFKNLKEGTINDYIEKFNLENIEFHTMDQSLFYAYQNILDVVNGNTLSREGLELVYKNMASEEGYIGQMVSDINKTFDVDIDTINNIDDFFKYLKNAKYSKYIIDYVNDYLIQKNITNETIGFENELTYVNLFSSFTQKIDGKYGIDENMSSMVMQYMKKAYINYVLSRMKNISENEKRGFMYYIKNNTFLNEFKQTGLQQQINERKKSGSLTRQERNIINFIDINYDYYRNKDKQKLGIWSPFVEYLSNLIGDLVQVVNVEEEVDDNGTEESYNIVNEVKQKDNQKSLREILKGEVKFLFSILSIDGINGFNEGLNTKMFAPLMVVITDIFNNTKELPSATKFYERINYLLSDGNIEGDRYIDQLVALIGKAPDKELLNKKNKTDFDNDRIRIWNLIYNSFNQSLQDAILETINIIDETIKKDKGYYDPETGETIGYVESDDNFDDFQDDIDYRVWDNEDDGSYIENYENEQQNIDKRYKIEYRLNNTDQFSTELYSYLSNKFNSMPQQQPVELVPSSELGLMAQFKRLGTRSCLVITAQNAKFFIDHNLEDPEKSLYNEIGKFVKEYLKISDNATSDNDGKKKIYKFLDAVGIKIKQTKYSDIVLNNETSIAIMRDILMSICRRFDSKNGVTTIENIGSIFYGSSKDKIIDILSTQVDCTSSFSSMNGEMNMTNRHALNSYLTQTVKIINSADFKKLFGNYKNDLSEDTYNDLVEEFPEMKEFIDSPYFDIALDENSILYKIFTNPLVVTRRLGSQILRKNIYRAGNTNFNSPSELKMVLDVLLANSVGLYTSAQWADKEVGLSFAMKDWSGKYIDIFDTMDNNESIYEFFYNNIKPYILAELKRISKSKVYIDNPWLKFNGDRKNLEKSIALSYFDKFFDISKFNEKYGTNYESWNQYVKSNSDFVDDVEKLNGIVSKWENIVKAEIESFFKKQYTDFVKDFNFENYVLSVGGKMISSTKRKLINEYNKTTDENKLVQKYLIGSWLWHLNTCILITDNHSNYDSYSKRIGTAISTGTPFGDDVYMWDLLNRTKGETYTEKYLQSLGTKSLDTKYTDVRDYLRVVTIDDIVATSLFNNESLNLIDAGTYEDMEVANAMGYVSFDTYRNCLRRVNRWSEKQEELYQRIVNLQSITEQEVKEHFPPLKLQDYAPMRDATIQQMVLLKNQYLPLVPTAIKGKGLEKLHEIMMRDGIDFVTTKNGSKCCDKTDHQQDLSSLFRFGKNQETNQWNNSILPESLRNVSIHAIYEDGNIVDIVKDNGKTAIEVEGKLNNEHVIYTEELVVGKDDAVENSVVMLRVVQNNGNIIALERCYVTTDGTMKNMNDGEIKITEDGITYEGNNVYISDNSFLVDAKYYRDQLEIHSIAGNQISIYTQFTSMASQNIFENGMPVQSINDTSEFWKLSKESRYNKWITLKENEKREISENYRIIKEFEDAFGAVCNYNMKKVFSKIANFDNKGKIKNFNYDAILNIIKKEADMSTDISQSVYRDINATNLQEYLNNSQYANPLMRLLIGRITKDLVKIKLYGDNLKQSPDLLFDALDETYELQQKLRTEQSEDERNKIKAQIDSKFKKLGFNTFKKVADNSGLLSIDKKDKNYSEGMKHTTTPEESGFYHMKDGKMQPCKIKITFCDEFLFLADNSKVIERAKSFYGIDEKTNQPIPIGIKDKDGNVLISNLCMVVNSLLKDNSFDDSEMDMFKCIGVRIPTQGYNFMDFMQISEFIDPALGPTIILPKEMVEKNGSDYDIDNMPIMFPHIASFEKYNNGTFESVAGFVNDKFIEDINSEIESLDNLISESVSENNFDEQVAKINQNNFENFVYIISGLDERTKEKIISLPLLSNEELKELVYDNSLEDVFKELILTFERYSKQHKSDVKEYAKLMKNALTAMLEEKANGSDSFVQCFNPVNDFIEEGLKKKYDNKVILLKRHKRKLEGILRNLKLKNLHNKFMLASYNLISADVNKDFLLRKSDTHYFTQDGESYIDENGKLKYGIYKQFGFNVTPKELMIKLNGITDEKRITSTEKLSATFNEFIRRSNNVNMTSLGIGAVGTKWASIFNEMGSVMKNKFKFGNTENMDVKLVLQHNEFNGHISISNMRTIDDYSKFELFNEIVSGFVDGAKDQWAAAMNFIVETTPIIEFMFWAGCKRDDIITLLNYKNIQAYVDKLREVKQGIGNYVRFSEYQDNKKKNGFLKDNINELFGDEFAKLYTSYESSFKKGSKIRKKGVLEFAFLLLSQINNKDFDEGSFITNMFKSKGKENELTNELKEQHNRTIVCKIGEGEEGFKIDEFAVKNFNLTYNCFSMIQYLMLEKMSNDITTFTTTFESDKNEYKTLAEINNYKDVIKKSDTSTFDYAENFALYKEKTNLGKRFYNEELFNVLTEFFNYTPLEDDYTWRNDDNLNSYIKDRIKSVKNQKTLFENLEDAKDKIYDYYFQNELVRKENFGIKMIKAEKNSQYYNFAANNGGYVRVIENGMYVIYYNDDVLVNEYKRNRSEFSCYKEFKNYVVERDIIYNLNRKKAQTLVLSGQHTSNENGKEINVYDSVTTGLTGDILYDAILKSTISDKTDIKEDEMKIYADMAFNTYCSVLAMFKTNNFKALFSGLFDNNISYASLFVNMLNDNTEITDQFPILKNLFVLKDGIYNSLRLSKQIDTNRSNAQFGDEVEQIMDVLYGKNGLMNVQLLSSLLSKQNLSIEQLNNKVKSIMNIVSMFSTFSMLQAGCNISGRYGLAKFGNDNYRQKLVSDKVSQLVKKFNEGSADARQQLDRILAFKTGDTFGETLPIGDIVDGFTDGKTDYSETYRQRKYNGDCLYDEYYNSEQENNNSVAVISNSETYYVVKISENKFYVLDKNYNSAHEGMDVVLIKNEIEGFMSSWDNKTYSGTFDTYGSPFAFTKIVENNTSSSQKYLFCVIINGSTKFFTVNMDYNKEKNTVTPDAKIKYVSQSELSESEKLLMNKLCTNYVLENVTSSSAHIPMPNDFLSIDSKKPIVNQGKEMLRSVYPQYFFSSDSTVSPIDYFVEQFTNDKEFREKTLANASVYSIEESKESLEKILTNKEELYRKYKEINWNIFGKGNVQSIFRLITQQIGGFRDRTILEMPNEKILEYINSLNINNETKSNMIALLNNDTSVIYKNLHKLPGNITFGNVTHNVIVGSNGNSVPIIKNGNTYYSDINGVSYKFDINAVRFINTFLDIKKLDEKNTIIFEVVDDDKTDNLINRRYDFADNIFIEFTDKQNKDGKIEHIASLFVTLNNKKYALKSIQKNKDVEKDGSVISPFFMNIYYTKNLLSPNLKRGGYSIATSVENLFSLASNTKTKILIDDKVKNQLFEEKNKDVYLKLLSNIAGISVEPISDDIEKVIADANNKDC